MRAGNSIFIVSCLLVGSCVGIVEDYGNRNNIPQIGLVAHYKLDNHEGTIVTDQTQHQNNGELKGEALWNSPGQFDGALEFNGTNFITIESNSDFDFEATTLAFWINTPRSQTEQTIASKGNDAWSINKTSQGTIAFQGKNGQKLISQSIIDDGEWHHVALSCHRYQAYVYIDGELDNQTTVTGFIGNNNVTLTIGAYPGSTDRNFQGLLDDVLIYNRALSSKEVKASGYAGISSEPDVTQPSLKMGVLDLQGSVQDRTGVAQFQIKNHQAELDVDGNWHLSLDLDTGNLPLAIQMEAVDDKNNVSTSLLTVERSDEVLP